MSNNMKTLSINLPDNLVKASQEAANKMGISRTEFIRQAVRHELSHFQEMLEKKAMANSMLAMKESESYCKETVEIDESFPIDLPEDKNEWWHKKKS
jgi:metal-responsive CopG/Arc/MetJ family transcriptional regulator